MFTDIRADNWVSSLPPFIRPYAYLVRADRPIGSWLLFWPGAWAVILATPLPDMWGTALRMLLLFIIGAPVMRGAGCIINDIWDRDLDRKVERTATRPLARSDISLAGAVICLAVLLTIGFFVLLSMPPGAIILGIASLPFILLYPLMKRFTYWPQAFLGLTFNFGALIGWAAVNFTLPPAALFLYTGGFFWTLAYDTVYAFQDIEDDRQVGIKSTAYLFAARPKVAIGGFYGGFLILTATAMTLAGGALWHSLFLAPALYFIARRLIGWRPDSRASALSFFKANATVGAWIFFACLASSLLRSISG